MKLYVVGETSPNPDDWSIWSEWTLVIAPNPERAKELSENPRSEPVTEIPLDRECVLCSMEEPSMGEDL